MTCLPLVSDNLFLEWQTLNLYNPAKLHNTVILGLKSVGYAVPVEDAVARLCI